MISNVKEAFSYLDLSGRWPSYDDHGASRVNQYTHPGEYLCNIVEDIEYFGGTSWVLWRVFGEGKDTKSTGKDIEYLLLSTEGYHQYCGR